MFGCPPSNATNPVNCTVRSAYAVNPGANPVMDVVYGNVSIIGVTITVAPLQSCPSPYLSPACTGAQIVQSVVGTVTLQSATISMPSLSLVVNGTLLIDMVSTITASALGVINAFDMSYGSGGGGGGHGGAGSTLKTCGRVATGGSSSLRAAGTLTPDSAFLFGGGAVYDASHGSRNIGSRGGGRIWIVVTDYMEVDGTISAGVCALAWVGMGACTWFACVSVCS